jgi:hypothetical protein
MHVRVSRRTQPLLRLHADVLLLIIALAGALALVFGVAVAGKVRPAGFGDLRRGVGELWFGPGALSRPARQVLAVALLTGEAAVLVALLGGAVATLVGQPRWSVPGFAGAAALLGAFTVAHAVALTRGSAARCACFGRTTTTVGPLSLLRTAVLLALALAGLALALAGSDPMDPTAALAAVPAGMVLGLLLISLEDLVALFRPSAVPPRRGASA